VTTLREKTRAKLLLTHEDLMRWQKIVGSAGFSAVCPLVHTMGLARRWAKLSGKVFLASLEFSFFKTFKPGQELKLTLSIDEKRNGWFFYSFYAGTKDTIIFKGRAAISGHKKPKPSSSSTLSSDRKRISTCFLNRQDLEQYLKFSGDTNPIHRLGHGNEKPIYPGLLLLGYVEADLKKYLNISWANSYAVKAKFRRPVFLGETIDIAVINKKSLNLEITASNRTAVTVISRPL